MLGIRPTNALVGRQATEAQLKLCEGMLADYKAVNGYKNIIGAFGSEMKTDPLPIQLPRPWITGEMPPTSITRGGYRMRSGGRRESCSSC